MKTLQMTTGAWIIRVLSWVVWMLLFSAIVIYYQVPSWELSTSELGGNALPLLVGCLVIWSLLLFGASLSLRQFALKRPALGGKFSPLNFKGSLRMFLISLAIWVMIDLLSATGMVLYFVSGHAWPVYTWVTAGLGLMCFFAPRVKPFLKT